MRIIYSYKIHHKKHEYYYKNQNVLTALGKIGGYLSLAMFLGKYLVMPLSEISFKVALASEYYRNEENETAVEVNLSCYEYCYIIYDDFIKYYFCCVFLYDKFDQFEVDYSEIPKVVDG